jgi:[protein-PII] uridylyltransferase
MTEVPALPITEAKEVRAFLQNLPLAVDAQRFLQFALGFPHRYLIKTSPVEVVRHYGLMEALGGDRAVISSLAREEGLWRLCLVARDRSFLFSRIAGCLSSLGMSIVSAEAFANANAMVLDTFRFTDKRGAFEADSKRRAFQSLLEEVIEGKAEPPALEAPGGARPDGPYALDWSDAAHPQFTRLVVEGPDRFGLLHDLSRALSGAGCGIEIAYVDTPGVRVRDEFYLTRDGSRLDQEMRDQVASALAGVFGGPSS